MKQLSTQLRRSSIGAILLLACILLLAACGGTSNSTLNTGSQQTNSSSSTTPTPTPQPAGIKLGTQACPANAKDVAYWNKIVPHSATHQIGKVTCGNLIGNTRLQALINLYNDGTGHIMTVLVYDNIDKPQPDKIFTLVDLYHGDARISGYNTVLTAEVDPNSAMNKNQSEAGLQQDIFREFKWSDSQHTLVQVVFPSVYPDLTRYQAELTQQSVNQGNDPWRLDPIEVATRLVKNEVKWATSFSSKLASGGGKTDLQAIVQITDTTPSSLNVNKGGTINITLDRFEGNANGGLWEVTGVTSPGLNPNVVPAQSEVHPGQTINAACNITDNAHPAAYVLNLKDHLNTTYSSVPTVCTGSKTLTLPLKYTSTFNQGNTEGALEFTPYANNAVPGVHPRLELVMVKVLIAPR